MKYEKSYETLLNAALMHKCFVTRMWHDSPHVFKQFTRIGTALSQAFVSNSLTSFRSVLKYDATRLDMTLNSKMVGFGHQVLGLVKQLPFFSASFTLLKHDRENDRVCINVKCRMDNYLEMDEQGGSLGMSNPVMILVGDNYDNLIFAQKLK